MLKDEIDTANEPLIPILCRSQSAKLPTCMDRPSSISCLTASGLPPEK
jgi:hypothetical protein